MFIHKVFESTLPIIMSDNLDKVLYMLSVCENVTDVRTVLGNVTDGELEDLKRFCRKTALDKIRKSSVSTVFNGSPFAFGSGSASSFTFGSGLFNQKPIKPEEMDSISNSILVSTHPFYKTFQERLNSFLNQWNYEHLVPGKALAEAGFINMKKGTDAVCCFICGLELTEWRKGDCPFFDHYRHNKDCLYIGKMQEMYPQVNTAIKEGVKKQGQTLCDFKFQTVGFSQA